MKEDEISRAYGTHGEKRISYSLLMIIHERKRKL